MKKTLDIFIRGAYLGKRSLHKHQFAYRIDKSTTTAIYKLTIIIEAAIEAKQVVFVALIDIQGAFDNMLYAAIERALKNKSILNVIIN